MPVHLLNIWCASSKIPAHFSYRHINIYFLCPLWSMATRESGASRENCSLARRSFNVIKIDSLLTLCKRQFQQKQESGDRGGVGIDCGGGTEKTNSKILLWFLSLLGWVVVHELTWETLLLLPFILRSNVEWRKENFFLVEVDTFFSPDIPQNPHFLHPVRVYLSEHRSCFSKKVHFIFL